MVREALLELLTFLSTPSARRATLAAPGNNGRVIFLSTPSARRATLSPPCSSDDSCISIHALREEGDLTRWP